ncbi:hypothetical protein LSH36_287g03032 [Paralvinella palmiformis]|uniref:Glycosyltransferase 61 catalytic domain-containing protein n=1 Tax=Paralvinella palmiformis TaxID=53620 RepID=A0AAD9N499_9ANNE|nr:hypothetical protein LSH36_287g03032 [Paralvinella palmiformis]
MRVPFPFVGKRSFLALIAVLIFLFVALLLPALEQTTGTFSDVYHNIIWDIRGLVNEDLSPEVGRHLDRVDLRDETTSWNKRPRQRQTVAASMTCHVTSFGYKIVPYHCRSALNNKVTNYNTELLPLYTELFSISQCWGGSFFHKTIEIFPKISPYLEFLKRKPHIKVQVYNKDDYTNFIMESLGIVRDRLISGVVRAHVIYLPRGTSCGTSNIQETQLLSHYLRLSVPKQEDGIRNLVLIRRSRSRSFTQQAKISEKLQVVAEEYGLKFYLFKDNPVPEMDEVRREFNKAAIVVAPHGAGLSNLLFCRPDTVVLEVICNPPHTNMCYTRLAHLLGLRYYALMSRGGCEAHINIPAEELEQLVRFLLKELKSRQEL